MKVANFCDPYSEKLSIRLSLKQLSFVKQYSKSFSLTPSQFFRSLLDSFIYSADQEIEKDENEVSDQYD